MIGKVSKVILFSVLSFSAASALGGQTHESKQTVDVETIVGNAVTTFLKRAPQVPGLSIGVLKGGKAYTYNYGTIDKGVQRQPGADTCTQSHR